MTRQVLPGAFTLGTVALVPSGFGPLVAWRGHDDEGIWYSGDAGSGFETPTQIPGIASSVGPALVQLVDQNTAADPTPSLRVLWKGAGSDERIWGTYYDPTTSWQPQSEIPNVGTTFGPSLANVGGGIYGAWRGVTGDEGLWWSRADSNFTTWQPQSPIPNTGSSIGPALSSFRGDLIAAWRGAGNDEAIWWSRLPLSTGSTTWTPQTTIPGAGSAYGPALAESGGTLYALWAGVTGDTSLWTSEYDGSSWLPRRPLRDRSGIRPALAVIGNGLCVAGHDPADDSVWFSTYVDLFID